MVNKINIIRIKKRKTCSRRPPRVFIIYVILLYFALNLQNAHKVWGRKFNHLMREYLMEYINKIELQGKVGTVRPREVNGNRVVNFSLVTDHLYKNRDGNAVSEATWFNIAAWEGRDITGLDQIVKGAVVHVTGRVRSTRFEGSDGSEKQLYEVLANKLYIVEKSPDTQQ